MEVNEHDTLSKIIVGMIKTCFYNLTANNI